MSVHKRKHRRSRTLAGVRAASASDIPVVVRAAASFEPRIAADYPPEEARQTSPARTVPASEMGIRLRRESRSPSAIHLAASWASTLPAPPVSDPDRPIWRRTVQPGPLVAAHLLRGAEKRVLDALATEGDAEEISRRIDLPLTTVETALAFLFARGLVGT